MWSSRLFWKLFLVYAGLNFTLAAGFLIVVTVREKTQVDQQIEQRLLDSAIVLRSHVSDLVPTAIDRFNGQRQAARGELQSLVVELSKQTGTRLTLVDVKGEVLADSESDPQTMLNHANREELIAAAIDDIGVATRRSPTLGVDMRYLALPIRQGEKTVGFVRVAMELETINQQVAQIRMYLWLLAIGVGLAALVLTYTMVGRMIRPLSELTRVTQAIASGEENLSVKVHSKDEIGLLASSFNHMQHELAKRMRQLRENSERLTTVLSSMKEGIIAVDANEVILMANEAGRQQLGFAMPEPVGRPLLEATRSLTVREAVQHALKNTDTYEREFESPDEPRRVLTLQANRLPGEPCPGVVVVLHEVTELRRLENLRRELVANVSHELKTPLASIKAYAETLRLGAVNDAENNLRFVAKIEEEAERLHQLILDLLQIARVESGEESFEMKAGSVGDVAAASVARYRELAATKRIDLNIQPSDPVSVQADKDGLRTVLDNLIDNAIKYTAEGGKVSVRWREEPRAVIVEVQDTGIGISVADQARVFERFYRADKARSRQIGGTGLGLSIVKHLVQAFGGTVALQSEVGKGCLFQIRLPGLNN